jgi:predicted alpha/beta-fold hydrolase
MEPSSFEHLPFQPFLGLSSPHIQTVLASFCRGKASPPSIALLISLEDGDQLCCEVSTPPSWQSDQKTVIMIHGLGGSHNSSYMIRISFKLYQAGYRVVRVNLRGCGSGRGLARLPYHGGISGDIIKIIHTLKQETPSSSFIVIGFSLGGNIALKLAGELAEAGNSLLQHTIAVCPPVDLAQTVKALSLPANRFYHRYYLNKLRQQRPNWFEACKIVSLYDFDNRITAPHWGFQNAWDYYEQCSSLLFLPRIQHSCHLLFAADDPFIDYRPALELSLLPSVKIWLCQYGGHMGFLSWTGSKHRYFWLDHLLLKWINESP